MKNFFLFFFLILIFGCTNVKIIYTNQRLNIEDVSTVNILKKAQAENKDKTIICFTNGFKNDTIELTNGKEILFKLPIQTIDQLGLAMIKTVNNNEKVNITFYSSKPIKFNLNDNDLKKYKFVYVSKKNCKSNKFIIEYSNKKRNFF